MCGRHCYDGIPDSSLRAEESGCRAEVSVAPHVRGVVFANLVLRYREMQLFLVGYTVIEICEIFSVGELPGLTPPIRIVRLSELTTRHVVYLHLEPRANFPRHSPPFTSASSLRQPGSS